MKIACPTQRETTSAALDLLEQQRRIQNPIGVIASPAPDASPAPFTAIAAIVLMVATAAFLETGKSGPGAICVLGFGAILTYAVVSYFAELQSARHLVRERFNKLLQEVEDNGSDQLSDIPHGDRGRFLLSYATRHTDLAELEIEKALFLRDFAKYGLLRERNTDLGVRELLGRKNIDR